MEKVYDSYEKLKKSYEGILTEDDVRECFQDDSLLNWHEANCKQSREKYLFLWIAFLLIFFVIIEKISEAPIVFPIVKEVAGKWRVIH